MKTKFNDNKLAEELDLIVLVDDTLRENGLPKGSLGTLTYSYTGQNRPLYAEFAFADGTTHEEALDLRCFRVLDAHNARDLSIIVRHLHQSMRKKA